VSRITNQFNQLRSRGEAGLVAFITAGDPNLKTTAVLVREFERIGVDVVELGVPFSDPLADGPTIQVASERALKVGTTVEDVLSLVENLRREGVEIPIVFMTYYNPMLQFGLERFAQACAESGVDGIIATDLPPEEGRQWIAAARANNVDTIFLLAPTSTDARVEAVAKATTGFIYCVARLGVTGARETVSEELGETLTRIRQHTQTPIAVGFGISKPEQVRTVCQQLGSDAVVVGSAIVNLIAENTAESEKLVEKVSAFVGALKVATMRDER
jgi:tryptophan synthase alpha chain